MTQIIQRTLSNAHKLGVELLDELDDDFSVERPDNISDIDYLFKLKEECGQLALQEEEIDDVLTDITTAHEEWIKQRAKMNMGDREADVIAYDTFVEEYNYHDTESNLKKELRRIKRLKLKYELTIRQIQPTNGRVQEAARLEPNNTKTNVPLPTLRLPTFDGKVSEWESFWDRFRFAVHDIPETKLPDVMKLSYLLECVKGKASNLIAGFPVQNSSYSLAVARLKEEFGRKDVIIKSLYSDLEKLNIRRSNSISLRKFVDELENVLMQLEHSGESIDIPYFYMSVQKKLPGHLLEEVVKRERKLQPDESKMKMVRETLKEILHRQEEVTSILEDSSNRNNFFRVPPRPTKPPNEEMKSIVHYNSFDQSVKRNGCFLCNDSRHSSENCGRYSNHDQRVERIKSIGVCFSCSKLGHTSKFCKNRQTCSKCGNLHLTCLCKSFTSQNPQRESHFPSPHQHSKFLNPDRNKGMTRPQACPRFATNQETRRPLTTVNHPKGLHPDNSRMKDMTNVSNLRTGIPVLLKCIKVIVSNPKVPSIKSEALVLLDDGSTTSYISNRLAKALKLKGSAEDTFSYTVFSDPVQRTIKSDIVSVNLHAKNGNTLNINGRRMDFLTNPVPHSLVSEDDRSVLFSKEIPIQCMYEIPDILIGSDFYYELNLSPVDRLPSGYQLLSSTLGHLLGGKANSISNCIGHQSNTVITLNALQSVDERVEDFFSLETLGIRDPVSAPKALEEFMKTIKFNGTRFEVNLPWRQYPPDIPQNYGLCLGRLRSVQRMLKNKPTMLKKYDDIIQEQLQLGIIEKVPKFTVKDRPIHYLPHHAVIKEEKKKVRIVYDGSAKVSKAARSLNECLDPGPVLLENLVGILMRFRIPRIVVACDIEKAFLQVSLSEEDRDVTRFLWLLDPFKEASSENLVSYRFTRVAFGLTSSPFLLAATLLHYLKHDNSEIAKEIACNLYVDNVLLMASNVESAKEKCELSKELFQKVSMNLREYVTNENLALEGLSEEDKLNEVDQKFLGVPWKTDSDCISFSFPTVSNDLITKRSVLKTIATLFDPLGILCPILLKAKLFFQELWKIKVSWDSELSVTLRENWIEIVKQWNGTTLSIARRVLVSCGIAPSSVGPACSRPLVQLHCFVDASADAFGCCVYVVDSKKLLKPSLVFAKNKVRPTRFGPSVSIHRMELLGAIVGARAICFVKDELQKVGAEFLNIDDDLNVWTDSSTVLHWLRSSSKQETFVENRLREIRNIANLTCRYVSTDENPADIASRGCSTETLQTSDKWWHGPNWLVTQDFPIYKEIPYFDSNSTNRKTNEVVLNTTEVIPMFDLSRFSSWNRLVRVTVWVLRFLSKFKQTTISEYSPSSNTITVKEFRRARQFLIIQAQQLSPPTTEETKNLKLYQDELGILRSQGRIINSSVDFDTANPIFLPAKNRITQLIIYDCHLYNLHAGSLQTLSLCRLKYWIPKGRRTTQQAIRLLCTNCRKLNNPAFRPLETPPLPAERIRECVPFEYTGVDYFGPITIRLENQTKKVWVCLFTCLVVRAIHLEIVYDLSSMEFIRGFRRFSARRGLPRIMYSDNGTQFVLAQKSLNDKVHKDFRALFLDNSFEEYFAEKGIKWEFITERAPWKGGFYERLIGIVKKHFLRCIGKSVLDHQTFQTLMTEIESVVNSRPITFYSENRNESTPLKPNDFLCSGDRKFENVIVEENDDEYLPSRSNKDNLLALWEKEGRKLKHFWTLWSRDYLLSLRERQKVTMRKGLDRIPIAGEVVLVYEENVPRLQWSWATVEGGERKETDPVRTVEIRFPSGRKSRRAIQHLFPLETVDEISERV